ncbi:MAG: acetyl-CoA carboxylase carboxyl transferase subunit alpha, partial [Ruminiclostridium sp.]|nr:acetyl-CoA carboxylase carboxyl transferase subunit alpha [Ruminiclostridium sp.]
EGYRKALRLMKQAEKFHRPVICFVGSSGAYCGVDAEMRGQGQAIAENLMEMMTLETQIITVIIGEGGSGGALALSVADKIIMPENSVYSVISPEGCATILWKDAGMAADAADVLKLTAADLKKFGIIDTLIEEKNLSNEEICEKVKEEIVSTIEANSRLSIDELLENRYNKYRNI